MRFVTSQLKQAKGEAKSFLFRLTSLHRHHQFTVSKWVWKIGREAFIIFGSGFGFGLWLGLGI